MIRTFFLLFVFALIIVPPISAAPRRPAEKWLTLSGKEPIVIAQGGSSGQFPYGSMIALDSVAAISMTGQAIIYCDLHLANDSAGFCVPGITLQNSTNILEVYQHGKKTYTINGKNITGWFTPDYSGVDLSNNITLSQHILSRTSLFDNTDYMLPLDTYLADFNKDANFWLNIQYEEFYKERNLSPIEYTERMANKYAVAYVSSPEIAMLKAVKVKKSIKRVFQFLGKNEIEPSTKKTYGEIIEDLPGIKAFASGIIVPKNYIWGVKKDLYLEDAPTTLVTDAHNTGLEVYAGVFANDQLPSLNYSMDPVMEYLQFIDNSQFAVDGLITDFPPSAEEATLCFAHNSNIKAPKSPLAKAVVISHNGASGVYPGSTDLAYEQAIADGADIIDCSVQITKDNVVFCTDGPDLTSTTTAVTTLMSRKVAIPDIQPQSGIFSFDLNWAEIRALKPQIFSPYGYQGYQRDPHNKYKGKLLTLVDFIQLAKTKKAPGILIGIEHAGFLAKKRGLDIIGSVTSALKNESLDEKSTLEVTIMSSDTQVLSRFKDVPNYKKLFRLEEVVESIPKSTTAEVKKYAQGMVVTRHSVLPTREPDFFLTHETTVVSDLHAAQLSVYVFYLRNEFVSLAFDYASDPTHELATLIAAARVDGVITDFPATASRYLRNKCLDITRTPAILPSSPGELIKLAGVVEAPAGAPGPALKVSDVVDPPLPPVDPTAAVSSPPPPAAAETAVAPAPKRSQASGKNVANVGLSLMLLLLLLLPLLLNVDYY